MITWKYLLLLAHTITGVSSTLVAFWILIESYYLSVDSISRFKKIIKAENLLVLLVLILGGIFYIYFYPQDKAQILKGAMPAGHTLFMEWKEHLFFSIAIISVWYYYFSKNLNSDSLEFAKPILKTVSIVNVGLSLMMSLNGTLVSIAYRIATAQ